MSFQVPTIFKAVDRFSAPVKKMERANGKFVDKMEGQYERLNRGVNRVIPSIGGLGRQIVGLAAIGGVGALSNRFMTLNKEIVKSQALIESYTNLSGKELEKVSGSARGIAEVFEKDLNEVVTSANSLAKGMGISFSESLDLVEKGLVSGADASGELLMTLKEYPTLMAESGLKAGQFVSLLDKSVKKGVFSDKGIDVIKEANIRLREMPKTTQEALTGIGLSSSAISKALEDGTMSTFDVIQKVSNRLGELPKDSAKVGTAIADIFGAAGEDAGLEYLKFLGTAKLGTNELTNDLTEQQKAQMKLLKANQKLKVATESFMKGAGAEIKLLKAEFMLFAAQTLEKWGPKIREIAMATMDWIRRNSGLIKTFAKITGLVVAGIAAFKAFGLVIAGVRKAQKLYNIALGVYNALAGKSMFALRGNTTAMLAQAKASKLGAAAMRIFGVATKVAMGPVGLILALITGLILVVRKMIKHWKSWGQVLALLMGPLGAIIFVVKSIYDRWDEVRQAFKDGGISGALGKIGEILRTALINALAEAIILAYKFSQFIKKQFTNAWDGVKDKIREIGLMILEKILAPVMQVLKVSSKIGIGSDTLKGLENIQKQIGSERAEIASKRTERAEPPGFLKELASKIKERGIEEGIIKVNPTATAEQGRTDREIRESKVGIEVSAGEGSQARIKENEGNIDIKTSETYNYGS